MRKSFLKNLFPLTIAAVAATAVCACAAQSDDALSAAEDPAPYDQLLEDVSGTYDELFTVICDPQYDSIWLDKCEAIVGADMAQTCADMLKSACTGTVYGEEAVAAYDDPEAARKTASSKAATRRSR